MDRRRFLSILAVAGAAKPVAAAKPVPSILFMGPPDASAEALLKHGMPIGKVLGITMRIMTKEEYTRHGAAPMTVSMGGWVDWPGRTERSRIFDL